MDHSRVIVWGLIALVAGLGLGYYLGFNFGYDQATNVFLAVK